MRFIEQAILSDLALLFVSCTTALMVPLRDFFLKAIFQVLASAV